MKELSAQDLLFGPIEAQPIATKPREILSLQREAASLPEGLSGAKCLVSDTWSGEPVLLLATEKARAVFDGSLQEGAPLSEHFTKQFSFLPRKHVRDGTEAEVCVWGEVGPSISSSSFHIASDDSGKSSYLSFAHPRPFRKNTVFLGAFPREEGIDFFWADRGEQSTNAIELAMGPLPDYELMYARWHPGEGPFALSDSLVKTFYGHQSLALLGENIEDARVTIEREGDTYRVAWFSREGTDTFLKGLVVDTKQYHDSVRQSYLSESTKPGPTPVPGIVQNRGVCVLVDENSARLCFSENKSGTLFGERTLCQGERLLVRPLPEGFALAWIEKGTLRFGLAGLGQKVFGKETKENYSPALHSLVGRNDSLEVDSQTEFTILRDGTETYLLWISDEQELLALAWRAQYPEVMATDIRPEARLIEGQSGHFYLLDDTEVSLCFLRGRGRKEER